jgi:hypothetical protein
MSSTPSKPARPGVLATVWRQVRGKTRRFYLHTFRRAYVEAQVQKRQGDCGRCAACCKLLFKCPFLDESGPIATCSIHDRRPDNCRFFPIDPRDLADRDLVDTTNPCGFWFPESERARGDAKRIEPALTVHGAMGEELTRR